MRVLVHSPNFYVDIQCTYMRCLRIMGQWYFRSLVAEHFWWKIIFPSKYFFPAIDFKFLPCFYTSEKYLENDNFPNICRKNGDSGRILWLTRNKARIDNVPGY